MALKGTLKDFSVADIFQLIGQQGKSGSLMVSSQSKEARIVFDHGKVVLGTFKKSDEDFLLGTMMLRAQLITLEQLTKAIENQKTTLRSIGDILKSMGVINSGVLSEFVALQLKEILFRIFQWKDGLYEFTAEKIQYNKAIIKPQSAEAVLMDGFRMLDEWPKISQKVGSAEGVFQALVNIDDVLKENPTENLDEQLDQAFSGFDEGDAPPKKRETSEEGMSIEEKRILPLFDGNRSLQEIIYIGKLGTFDTYKASSQLLDRNYIEKVNELVPTQFASQASTVRITSIVGWGLASVKAILSVFIFSILVPILAFGIHSHWSQRYDSPQSRRVYEANLSYQEIREVEERSRIVEMLELHRLQNGGYPYSLDDLQNTTFVSRWDYQKEQSGYILNPKLKNK